jgi:hypothetical protein
MISPICVQFMHERITRLLHMEAEIQNGCFLNNGSTILTEFYLLALYTASTKSRNIIPVPCIAIFKQF